MRQVVKTEDGELTYGSMAEIKVLYEQGFIQPEDLIRAADSTRWVKAGTLPLLRGAQTKGKTETAMGLRIALAIGVSVVLAGIAQHSRAFFLAGLVFVGVLTPFFVYGRTAKRRS